MIDNKVSKNYETIGQYLASEKVEDGLRPLMKCTRCGALVNGGGLSREKHDQFHAALADLFEQVDKLQSGSDGNGND